MSGVYLIFYLKHRRYTAVPEWAGGGWYCTADRKHIMTQLETLLAGHFIENNTQKYKFNDNLPEFV